MQPHAVIVNTARGPLIDETALVAALNSGTIAAAGLDVLEQEPPAPDNPLLFLDNVLISSRCLCHHADATGNRRRVGREVALVLQNKWPMSCVNPTVLPRAPLSVGNPIQ